MEGDALNLARPIEDVALAAAADVSHHEDNSSDIVAGRAKNAVRANRGGSAA
jgi:hypothetical protein